MYLKPKVSEVPFTLPKETDRTMPASSLYKKAHSKLAISCVFVHWVYMLMTFIWFNRIQPIISGLSSSLVSGGSATCSGAYGTKATLSL